MKKLILCLMILSCVFMFVGCGKKKESSKNLFDDEPVEKTDDKKVDVPKDEKVDVPRDEKVTDTPIYGSKQEVVCTQKASGVDIEMVTELTGNKVTGIDFTWSMDLSGYNDAQINIVKNQDFCTTVKQSMTGYSNAFENCRQTIYNKALIITAEINIDKVDDASIRNSTTASEIKAGLEQVGYTCMVK